MFLVNTSFIRHYVDADSSIKWYMNVHPENLNDVVLSGAKLNGVYKLEFRVNEF